jgi:two-component system chemotaxis response regulator CheY
MRRQLCAALRRLDIEPAEAGDGAEAWRLLQGGRFHIVLTDVNMPLVDGLKLLGLIRAGGAHQRVPVMVLTTEAGEEDRRRALGLGASAYLLKPVTEQQVMDAVRELLRLG